MVSKATHEWLLYLDDSQERVQAWSEAERGLTQQFGHRHHVARTTESSGSNTPHKPNTRQPTDYERTGHQLTDQKQSDERGQGAPTTRTDSCVWEAKAKTRAGCLVAPLPHWSRRRHVSQGRVEAEEESGDFRPSAGTLQLTTTAASRRRRMF